MAYFPMFIEMEGMKCLIVGGGNVAFRKVLVLCDFGAIIKVVAGDICGSIKEICRDNEKITCEEKCFSEDDLEGIELVVAATDDKQLNHDISVKCRERGIYINAVDQVEDCGFIFPSYVRERDVVGAFSSGGKSPVITQYLKECIRESLTPFLGETADFLGSLRPLVKERTKTEGERRQIYRTLLQMALEKEEIPGDEDVRRILEQYTENPPGEFRQEDNSIEKRKEDIRMDRMRRLRKNEAIRSMVRENHIRVEELIYPIFVIEGENICNPIESMPGICQYSIDRLSEEMDRVKAAGIPAVLLFGVPAHKDEAGSGAYAENGIIRQAIRFIRENYSDTVIIADVCLCEYTSHGHCGLVKDGKILNDETLPLLAKAAVSYAEAGADIVAPSDMMDKRVAAIREALDKEGFTEIPIMSYSAKFASCYYSPFRDAAHSAPGFGDRKTYQMDPANGKEALREVEEDILEGADFIIAKPALGYMDVIKDISIHYNIPIAAYNVSGEYSMVKAAAAKGWIDEKKTVMENMVGLKRAGAKMIITYHALDAAKWIKEMEQDR